MAADRPGPTMQELHDREKRPVPVSLRSVSSVDLGTDDVPVARYTSAAFHASEVEHLWKRVWQMACREEDIPNVGDTLVYELADLSFLVVRSAPDVIKAFPNACLHRGALLRTADGNVPELRCPFHGFCWDLDGWLKDVPCAWDFPHVTAESFTLPQVQVAMWEGFVFINPDPHAPPLDEFLGEVRRHVADIARPTLQERFKAVHVAKVVPCNWKVAMEAFLESYHVMPTHPQALLWGGDVNTEYCVYPDEPHWNRMITAAGIPSPHLGPDVAEQDIADTLQQDLLSGIGIEPIEVPEGSTAREVLAENMRGLLQMAMGFDATDLTDCQVLDTIEYFVFPNFVPFIGVLQSLVYRFRPHGNDPHQAIMEIMLLYPIPEGLERPAPIPIHWLGPDDDWTAADELGMFAPFLNQDLSNLGRVQRGLRAMTKPGVTLSEYQESRIRHFHQVLGGYVPAEPTG